MTDPEPPDHSARPTAAPAHHRPGSAAAAPPDRRAGSGDQVTPSRRAGSGGWAALSRRGVLAGTVAAWAFGAAPAPGRASAARGGQPAARGAGWAEREIWSVPRGPDRIRSGPTAGGGRLYLAQGPAVRARRADTGEPLWDHPVADLHAADLVATPDGVLAMHQRRPVGPAGARNVALRSLAGADGAERWRLPADRQTGGIGVRGGWVVTHLMTLKANYHEVWTCRLDDGGHQRTVAHHEPVGAHDPDGPARVLYQSTDGAPELSLRELVTGAALWRRPGAHAPVPGWDLGGHLVVLRRDPDYARTLVSLDAGTGAAGWELPLGETAVVGATREGDTGYLATDTAGVLAVDLARGAVRWRRDPGAPATGLLATAAHLHVTRLAGSAGDDLLSLHAADGSPAAAALPGPLGVLTADRHALYRVGPHRIAALRPA